ncbi:MAG: bifunctional metallophosphatase/5'-nucleotidase [Myxococcaceae bacterium]
MPHRRRALLLALLLVASCKTPQGSASSSQPLAPEGAAPPGPIHLTIAGTNDIHGWVHPHGAKLTGGISLAEGGVANFAGYLAILRAANPGGVLLVDAGDLFQGTLASNLTEGAVVIDAYNALGYHAGAIGNHEFDYGPVGPVSATPHGQDSFGALKQRIKQARFPLLAANIYQADTGERPAWLPNDGTAIFELKGVKVGVVGVVTPATPRTTNPVNVGSLRFGSLAPEVVDGAKRLRAKGAEVVIALVHGGGKCAAWDNPRDLSTCDTRHGEIFEMMNGVPAGTVQAVVAGDTHSVIGHFVNGAPVIESYGLGRYFGTIDLYLDPARHTVLEDRTVISTLIPICAQVDEATGSCDAKKLKGKPVKLVASTYLGKPVVADPAIATIVKPALDRVEAEQAKKLGIKVPHLLGRNYEAESALGSFLADSLRDMEGADIALLNSGGLRADIAPGELTYGAAFEVIPFDNTVATISLNGEELKRLLRAAYGARKGVFQQSGLKVKLSPCPGADRLKEFTLADGKAIDPQRLYRVVVPDFLARGGDGLGTVLSKLPAGRIDLGEERGLNFRDSLVDYWKKKRPELIAPKLGRMVFVEDGEKCISGTDPGQ